MFGINCHEGDVVVVFKKTYRNYIVEKLNTISYEILTNFHVKRIFFRDVVVVFSLLMLNLTLASSNNYKLKLSMDFLVI
jgi:hypothetical protein